VYTMAKVTLICKLREMISRLDKAGEREAAIKILELLDDPTFRKMASIMVIKEDDGRKGPQ